MLSASILPLITMPRSFTLLVSLSLFASSLRAQVCDAAAFGSITQDPLTITGSWTVGDGCVLDFGPRHVIVDGAISVQDVEIYAAKLTVTAAGEIKGSGGQVTNVVVRAAGPWDGSVLCSGKISQSVVQESDKAGKISIQADGPASFVGSEVLTAKSGRLRYARGGIVTVECGGDLIVDGLGSTAISVEGETARSYGGEVLLQSWAGSVLFQEGEIRADGSGDGVKAGAVTLGAPQGSVDVKGKISCFGWGRADGGTIEIQAGACIAIRGKLAAYGSRGGANFYYYYFGGGNGGLVQLTAGGSVTVTRDIDIEGGFQSAGGQLRVECGGDYVQDGGKIDVHCTYGGAGASATGGSIQISAQGAVQMAGVDIDARGDQPNPASALVIRSGQDLLLDGVFVDASGWSGGTIEAGSEGGAARISGALFCEGSTHQGGRMEFSAATHLDLRGCHLSLAGKHWGGTLRLRSGLSLRGGAETKLLARARTGGAGGTIDMESCRVDFPAGSLMDATGTTSGNIRIIAGDVLDLGGELRAYSGTIDLITRLPSPYSPILTGAVIVPPPSIIHDPTLPPCLALDTTSLTASSPVSIGAGEPIILGLRSVPDAKVVVLADFTPAYLPAGRHGYLQLDPASAYRLADAGYLGTPIAGSTTDAQGAWSFTSPPVTNPALIGRTLYVEALVRDPQARNGWFHQTPLTIVDFVP